MDSEVTNLAQVKSFDSSDYATAAQGALADSAQQPPSEGAFANGDKTKLDGIAASADVNRTMDASPTNGNTNNSVSSDGVYDALELKAPKASPSFTGNATIAGDLTVTGNTIYSGSGPRIDFASGGHYLKFWQSGSDQNFKIMVDTQDADTDAQITFSESSAIKWNIGNDGSDSHTFKISSHSGGILSTDTELSLDTSGNLTTTGDVNGASPTEMGYLSGVTSAIQTQLNSKQATLTFGIANGNSLQVDEPDGGYTASSGDIAQFTSTGIKGVDHVSAIGKDEDDMVSDSATHFPTQQSVKAYVDASSDPKHWMDWFYYAANLASQNYFYAALHNNHTGVSSTINTDLSTSGYNTTTLNNAWRMIRYARRVPYAGTITKFMAHLEASGTAADSDVEVALWKADALADDTAHSSTGNFTCDHLGTLTYDFSSSSRHMTKQTTTFNATSISEGDWLFITLRRTTSGDGSYFHCHSTVLWDGA
jgi:hypothetical protein